MEQGSSSSASAITKATTAENTSLAAIKPQQWSLTRSFSEANVRDLSSYMNHVKEANYYYGRDESDDDDYDDDDDDDDDDNDEEDEDDEGDEDDGEVEEEDAATEQKADEGGTEAKKSVAKSAGKGRARNPAGLKGATKGKKAEPALDVPPIIEEFLKKLFVVSGFETPQWLADILCFFHENLELDSRQQVDHELSLLSTELDNTSMNSTPQEFINACGAAFQLLGNVVNTVAQAELEAPSNSASSDEAAKPQTVTEEAGNQSASNKISGNSGQEEISRATQNLSNAGDSGKASAGMGQKHMAGDANRSYRSKKADAAAAAASTGVKVGY